MFFEDDERKVIGFLYSISRGEIAEYWPLHLGYNTLGSSFDNDITLLEGSILSNHAVIRVDQAIGLSAYIQDKSPTNGTKVNGCNIGLNEYECRNGDIIEIGHYILYLVLIDSDAIGLKAPDSFERIDESNSCVVLCDCSSEPTIYDSISTDSVSDCSCSNDRDIVYDPTTGEFETLNKETEPIDDWSDDWDDWLDDLTCRDYTSDAEITCQDICVEETESKEIAHQSSQETDYTKKSITYEISRKFVHLKELFFFSKGEYVSSSIFAPAEVKIHSHMLIQLYLHLIEDTENIKVFAQEADKDAERRDYIPLLCKLKEGDKVDVFLNIYGNTILMSERKSIVWLGHFTKCSFDYVIPDNIGVNELSCLALLSVNGIPVGEMRFITKIVEVPRQLNPEIVAHKYNKVFISYSHQDESKVKFLHEGLELGGIPHFFDRQYLKAGDYFPKVIQDYINSADLFILCWSENASKSEYVNKERLQALKRAFPQVQPQYAAKLSIYPLSFEPHAELPGDMKDNYHFGEI